MKGLFNQKSYWLIGVILFIIFQFFIYTLNDLTPIFCKKSLQISFIISCALSFTYFKISTKSSFSIYTLFLLLFIFFLGSRVILDFFGYLKIEELTFYKIYTLSGKTICRSILNLNIAVLSFLLGVVIYTKINKKTQYKLRQYDSTHYNNLIIHFLFFIGISIKAYFAYITFTQLQDKGYLAYFLGEFEIQKNIIQWLFESFALIALFISLTCNKTIKLKIWIGIFIFFILSLATGQRGYAFLFLVFSFFYLYQLGKLNLTKLNIISLFIALYIISVFFELYRRGTGEGVEGLSFLVAGIPNFFWGGGVSFSLIAYTIDYKDVLDYTLIDLFGNVKYLTEYYGDKILGKPPPENMMYENATNYKLFGPMLSYTVNPKMYSYGFALGGSYVAQLFALGYEFAQLIGGVFVGYIISIFYSFLNSKSLFIRFVGFHFLISFIYIPRDNMFDFITENWIVYFAFLVYLIFINSLAFLKKDVIYSNTTKT